MDNHELNDIQSDAFSLMSEYLSMLEPISPFFETEVLYKSFSDSCTEVLFGKSTSEEQAEILYDVFRNYQNEE